MTDAADNAYGLDRELLREQLMAAVLKGRLALVRGQDEAVSAYLGELAVALADDTEVVRVDASQSHSASALVQALARSMDVPADDLLGELNRRGETLPLALVIDNGECLGSRALTLLRNLLTKSGGGLGVLIGGEPDLPDLLAQAGITPACEGAAEPAASVDEGGNESEPNEPHNAGWADLVPWKHLGAVAGLLLLVWVFWPAGDEQARRSSSSELQLPPPGEPEADEPGGANADPSSPSSTTQAPGGEASASAPLPNETRPAATPDNGNEAASPEPRDAGAGSRSPEPGSEPAVEPGASVTTEDQTGNTDGAREVDPTGLEAELAYRSEDWLLTRTPEHWMLQLALATNEQRARDLLDRLGRDQGAYYRARRDGEVVYIVLAGPFGSRGQAMGAGSSLPSYFRERGPFPRRIRAIAGEIRTLSAPGTDGG